MINLIGESCNMGSNHHKIRIFAEKEALIQLSLNKEFIEGKILKQIFRQLSEIFLIMNEVDFEQEWSDSESPLRKFFDAYDIPRPRALSGLQQIYKNPSLCVDLDPFALWLFNSTEQNISRFRDYLGVWAINPQDISDDYFALEHPREYDKDDIISGTKDNGWGNYIEELPKELPPINSIVLNDRHLLFNTNENNAITFGFYGLNNLKALFNELLPPDLKVPFHILVFCQHPKMAVEETDSIVSQFIHDVQDMRTYDIDVEFVYDKSRHKRDLYTNYFRFWVDRAYNAFYNGNMNKLNGENDFNIVSYLNNPFSSGDTEYDSARNKLKKISNQCKEAYLHSSIDEEHEEMTTRTVTTSDDFFNNRLFK